MSHRLIDTMATAVCRARSKAQFVAKMGVVVEEADETVFWLELLVETEIVKREKMNGLLAEANEPLAIFAASHHTARKALNSATQQPVKSIEPMRQRFDEKIPQCSRKPPAGV